MPGDPFLDDFPVGEPPPGRRRTPPIPGSSGEPGSRAGWLNAWEALTRAGLAEITLRLGTHALVVALILFVAWGMREFYRVAQVADIPRQAAYAAPLASPTVEVLDVDLPPIDVPADTVQGVARQASLHTDLPSQARMEVDSYEVAEEDTLLSIAEKFGLRPETVLWANQLTLGDNPHNLRPGQKLNILPVNGAYYKWSAGDGLNGVARFFGVSPEAIIDFPGNHLNRQTLGDPAQPNIEPGTWLIIPGGRREFVSRSAPAIPRDKPEIAAVLGPGACKSIGDGAVGAETFAWPTDHHAVAGLDYNPNMNHNGIDLAGEAGNPVYAVDNGVVVYSGWNNWGYGNMIVINHGNGWQTLYAHLSAVGVSCGQSVYQTDVIGSIGNTGNASSPHLHFEMMYNDVRVNPHDYLPR